jgi:putative serine protease PepD
VVQTHRRRAAAPILGAIAAAMAACGGVHSPTHAASSGAPQAAPSASANAAAALQQAYVSVVRKVLPSVVQIESDAGLGSGVVFDNRGDIVTNNHVILGSTVFTVTTAAGARCEATLVGTFPPDDLAVIHVSGVPMSPATFGDSSKLEIGDIVMAVGNPLGLQSSVTVGIVSAVDRTVSEDSSVVLPDTIQTSAEINPGNSGGALVDLAGQVIGIPTLGANGQAVGGPEDLSQFLAQLSPGDRVRVEVVHQDGTQQTLAVTLGELPS